MYKLINYRNSRNVIECRNVTKQLYATKALPNYAVTAPLDIPNNIDPAETTRFSPSRSRDISANVILSQFHQNPITNIDITADNSYATTAADTNGNAADPHIQSYDCFGAVSLNSVMQSNVPSPFGGMHKFTHLNMPGGQWSQECKFTSQNLQSSHYTALRENARSTWLTYDQDATITQKVHATNMDMQSKRSYCTKADSIDKNVKALTKKEQLKKAFKEYGSTIVVFHVAISLASLGACYALVSGGIDMMPLLDTLGLSSTALANKVATGASTFVVAYAIHKVFAPVRVSITLGAAPFIVRYLRSKGFLKPKIIK